MFDQLMILGHCGLSPVVLETDSDCHLPCLECYQSIHISNLAGVLIQGAWKLVDQLKDPDLRDLASRLLQTILYSRANSTVKKYFGAFKRWKLWAVQHNLTPIPAKPHEFSFIPTAHRWIKEVQVGS